MTQSQTPLVSLIMPVFNCDALLRASIGTLLRQTYERFELICVDDGSTDASKAILDEYANSDERIVVVEQEHGGGGAARNLGLDMARGTYVAFLDADDYFDEMLLQRCVEVAQQRQADVVVHDAAPFDSATGAVNRKKHYLNMGVISRCRVGKVFSGDEIPDEIMGLVPPAPWLRLYRRQFLRDESLTFQELPNSNDWLFGYLSLCCARRITILDEQLVYYRTGNAQSTQGNKSERAACVVQAICGLMEELKRRGLYSRFEKGYAGALTTALSFSLKTLNCQGRDSLLDAVRQADDAVLQLLLRDKSWYASPTAYENARMVHAALTERVHWQELEVADQAVLAYGEHCGNPMVSVVVPAYNMGENLDMTIASVLGQTDGNLEVICVNDGSTDDTLRRMRRWVDKDRRVVVYSQHNQGLSAARNVGIAHARGTYVMFLDCDDALRKDAIERLRTRAEAEALDVLSFTSTTFSEDGVEDAKGYGIYYQRQGCSSGVLSGKEMIVAMYGTGDHRASACRHLIRTAYLRESGLQFHKGILREDNPFAFALLMRARRVAFENQELCLRRLRPDSIAVHHDSFAHSFGYYMSYVLMDEEMGRQRRGLTPVEHEVLSGLLWSMVKSSREQYLAIPKDQRGSEFGVGSHYAGFNELVVKYCRNSEKVKLKNRRIKELESERDRLSEQVSSKAYQVGLALVTPYRTVLDAIRSRKVGR